MIFDKIKVGRGKHCCGWRYFFLSNKTKNTKTSMKRRVIKILKRDNDDLLLKVSSKTKRNEMCNFFFVNDSFLSTHLDISLTQVHEFHFNL